MDVEGGAVAVVHPELPARDRDGRASTAGGGVDGARDRAGRGDANGASRGSHDVDGLVPRHAGIEGRGEGR